MRAATLDMVTKGEPKEGSMNRNPKVKLTRSAGAAALVAALVVSGAGIAGASSNGTWTSVSLNARASDHDHGGAKVHPIDGVITAIGSGSFTVSSPRFTGITVTYGTATKFIVGHTVTTTATFTSGERVFVTPAAGATMTNYTAATIRIVPTKIRPIEGMISSVNGTTSMVVTVRRNVTMTVLFSSATPATVVTMGDHTVALVNLVAGERVHVTPSSTSTTASYVASKIAIQSTKIHPIDGVVASVNGTTSMVVTTRNNLPVTVYFGAETLLANGVTVSALTGSNVSSLTTTPPAHVHVVLVPGPTGATPQALLIRIQPQS